MEIFGERRNPAARRDPQPTDDEENLKQANERQYFVFTLEANSLLHQF
jgi:hypothetical protein